MGDEELINYILRSREKGRNKEQIVRALYSVGWKKDKVEAAFQKLDNARSWQSAQPQASQPPTQAKPSPDSFQQKQQQPPKTNPQMQSAPAAFPQAAGPAAASGIPPQKKPLFSFPQLFGKKPPSFGQQHQQAEPVQPQQPAPPLQQPASIAAPPVAATAPQPQQQAAAISPSTQQPVGGQQAPLQQSSPPQQAAYSAGGIMPPTTTFTIGGAQQANVSADVLAKQEPHTKNPAFSNLAAAASSAAGQKKIIPVALVVALLVLAAGYYFFQMRPSDLPAVDGPHINISQQGSGKDNATKPVQNATKKPVVVTQPPKNNTPIPVNATKKNPVSNATLPKQNVTSPSTNSTNPAANASSTSNISQPNPVAPQNTSQSGSLQVFSRYSQFQSSEGFPPSKFCQERNAALYRVHYREFYGTQCSNEKPKQDYVVPIDFPYACDFIPCCYNDASFEFSRLYDSFECGYYG